MEANTQAPKTTLDILAKMQVGDAGPHGDELWERISDTRSCDAFGDEIHELFSKEMGLINNANQTFKGEYWEPNEDVLALVRSVNTECQDTPKSPASTALKATVLFLMANQPSPLGQATKNDMNAAMPGLSVESVMEGPENSESLSM